MVQQVMKENVGERTPRDVGPSENDNNNKGEDKRNMGN